MKAEKIKTRLMNKALHYLSRYASTEAKLEEVLRRFADRKMGDDAPRPAAPADLEPALAETIAECVRLGYVNDTAYAEMKWRRGRSAGKSRQMISQSLRQAGIDKEIIEETARTEQHLIPHDENSHYHPELQAALLTARKKRIGPYRRIDPLPEERRALMAKEMARLARAGFGFDICKQIFDLNDQAEAEALLDKLSV